MKNCIDAIKRVSLAGCAIMIITARPSEFDYDTKKELNRKGITESMYDRLLSREEDESAAESKLRHRNAVRKTHDLIFAIGDCLHDLVHDDEDPDGICYNILMETL